jgi:hypothetical protein
MRSHFILFLFAVAFSYTASAQAQDDLDVGVEEVIVPVTIEPNREIAFFVSAPRSVAGVMRKAAREACAASGGKLVGSYGDNIPEHHLDWLCDGSPMKFFRGIGVNGGKFKAGFICSAKETRVGFKYNKRHMFLYADCVWVSEGSRGLEIDADYHERICRC